MLHTSIQPIPIVHSTYKACEYSRHHLIKQCNSPINSYNRIQHKQHECTRTQQDGALQRSAENNHRQSKKTTQQSHQTSFDITLTISCSYPAHARTKKTKHITGPKLRTFNNLGEGAFRLVGCSGVLVLVEIKVRAKTQPNP